ncbi:MAG: sirohydrochlorin chelatase [Pirellulales bacterium]|nr:sirohydrochlorin chelatase [Pirellulales bacterium]
MTITAASPPAPHQQGILLIGHGTRDPAGLAEFEQLARLVQQTRPDIPCAHCWLELAKPDIPAGIQLLVERGVRQILAAPLLLFAAGHAKADIPTALTAALREFPDVTARQIPPLGLHPSILALSATRLVDAVQIGSITTELSAKENSWRQSSQVGERFLLMIGRGAKDPAATATMREFAARRASESGVGRLLTCFLAVQRPQLWAGLEMAAQSLARVILVQPHLLFQGLLMTEIAASVAEYARNYPQKHWYLADHLGPAKELAAVIVELCDQVEF